MQASLHNSNFGYGPIVQLPFDTFAADEYTDSLEKVCGRFRVEPWQNGAKTISGSVQHRLVSRFDTALVALDARRVLRDKVMIRADPGEHLFLIYQQKGQCKILQNDQYSELHGGDFFIADSSVPSEFIYDGKPSVQVSLHLPRDEMVSRLGKNCVGGQAIDRNDPLMPAISSLFRHMLVVEKGSTALGEALVNIFSEYFAARQNGSGRLSTKIYQRAVERLHARAADSTFGLDSLSSELGVSRRTLQRIFADHGDNFTGQLQAVRLNLARIRLAQGHQNIASVAFEAGFNDISNFYRLFKEKFGVTPGQAKGALM